MSLINEKSFIDQYRGGFYGVLQWRQLEDLFQQLRNNTNLSWYVYDLDQNPPENTASADDLTEFLRITYELLRREHREDYCGIVYADDLSAPSFIKIYHPKKLGVVCGIGREPVPPGWILSLNKPVDLASLPRKMK